MIIRCIFRGHILLNCAAVWIMSQTNRNGRGAIERIWFNHWITICIIRLTFKISTHTCIFNLSANNFNSCSVFFKNPTWVIIKIYLARASIEMFFSKCLVKLQQWCFLQLYRSRHLVYVTEISPPAVIYFSTHLRNLRWDMVRKSHPEIYLITRVEGILTH